MQITKQQLQAFLTERPAISLRKLSNEAGLHNNAINQLFNGCNRNITKAVSDKIMEVLPKYGFKNEFKIPVSYKVCPVCNIEHNGDNNHCNDCINRYYASLTNKL